MLMRIALYAPLPKMLWPLNVKCFCMMSDNYKVSTLSYITKFNTLYVPSIV